MGRESCSHRTRKTGQIIKNFDVERRGEFEGLCLHPILNIPDPRTRHIFKILDMTKTFLPLHLLLCLSVIALVDVILPNLEESVILQ